MSSETGADRPLVAVLDYGIGNLRSAQKALEKVGADARLTADAGVIADAAGVVLPGVGAFGRCMEALADAGLATIAHDAGAAAAAGDGRPFLGVCVGMQMLFDGSDESPGVPGLGVVGGQIRLIPEGVKRPQMQWNVLDWAKPTPMADGQPDPSWVYFVHSYFAEVADPADVAATCEYGVPVTAAIQRNALWATQFHPEKSAGNGLRLLAAFVGSLGG
ncbi:imidazole glycerol phosphate synthase subunit HisH [Aquihabitans sp. G128]|uniref:imidazole glycerol phosphate synthase subunit HisH n=1 Tax=Aquihabitans sp. G128 TaxID=2849779 RepID=UPI001C21D91D|nr:imidazole glycerol phosphate synthase subunit HisH [Aquihabitans sp. G128]QXC62561.1 imidazole glycerol phosphate synthase subunit HisH [Aquihabitans sp. G128]